MFQLKKVFVQFLPKIIIYFSKKKNLKFFFTIFQVDRQDLLSCKDYLIYHWQNGWRVLRVQIFFFFISYKKNKICNSCFLAKTKREGNEIVVLCWFCQNFSKVHSKCVREKTPLKVDPLGKKLCVFLRRPFDEFLWDKLSIKLQKNESCEPCAFARAQILWHLLDRLVNKIFFEIQFLNIFFWGNVMCGEIGASGCHTSTQVGLAMSRPHPPLINPCQLDFAKRNPLL